MSRPDTRSRSERSVQVLSGFVIGLVVVYGALLARRGFIDAFVILLVGLSYLLMRLTRVRWLATGFFVAGIAGLLSLLAVVVAGRDWLG